MSVSDYLAQIKIKNGRIWSLMKKHGIETQAELARLANLTPTRVGEIMNFKKSPMTSEGTWCISVLRIADVFGVLPDEMFSPEQLMLEVKNNRRDYLISHDDVMLLANQRESHLSLAEDEKDAEMMQGVIGSSLDTLLPREKLVIELRFGLGEKTEHTLTEAGEVLGVSRERVRQLEAKALRKLRHPKLSFNLITAAGEAPPEWLVRQDTMYTFRQREVQEREDDQHSGE